MEVEREIAGCDQIKILVIAFDPVKGRVEGFVATVGVGYIANAKPGPDVGMLPHDAAHAGEISVNIAKGADLIHLLVVAGTSRSALSQMKSLLL